MASISWNWQADYITDSCRLPGETVTDHFVGPRESQIHLPRKANKSQLGTEVKKKFIRYSDACAPLWVDCDGWPQEVTLTGWFTHPASSWAHVTGHFPISLSMV